MGFVVALAYSFYLCAAVKLYILTSVLVVGMLGYFAAEYLHRKTPTTAGGDVTTDVATAYTTQNTLGEKLVLCSCLFNDSVVKCVANFTINISQFIELHINKTAW